MSADDRKSAAAKSPVAGERVGAATPARSTTAATVDPVAIVNQQADRIAWLQGDVAGWRIKLAAAEWAFADALLALEELGHAEVADRLRDRWSDVAAADGKVA